MSLMEAFGSIFPHSRKRNIFLILQILGIFFLFNSLIYQLKQIVDIQARNQQYLLLFASDHFQNYRNASHNFDHVLESDVLKEEHFHVEVLSSKDSVKVAVDGDILYDNSDARNGRGIHAVVLNQTTGALKFVRHFDTYLSGEEDLLCNFLDEIDKKDYLLVFAIKDEASYSLSANGRNKLHLMGSKLIAELGWRSMWAMVTHGERLLAEDISSVSNMSAWPEALHLSAVFQSTPSHVPSPCEWTNLPDRQQRLDFCSKYDSYGDICSCQSPLPLPSSAANFGGNLVYNMPVVVIASNRPYYLNRMLQSLLEADGVNKKNVIVFIDGYFEEAMEITKLFGVRGLYHTPSGVSNARISQHYLSSLSATFDFFPEASCALIFEEDLDVSPDIFRFFSQTLPLLNSDSSLYCVSAWNDQGYLHSSKDPSLLYRVETMPGLGWMLKRSLFEEELKPQWPGPDKQWDWDMWMRHPSIRKGRECVIPDVSRTFHFGKAGVNINKNFYDLYFASKSFNKDRNIHLQDIEALRKENYERHMHQLVRQSQLLNHSRTPCDVDFVPADGSAKAYVAYFSMDAEHGVNNFIQISKCLKIWDLDARGLHKSAFRTFVKQQHVIFIGYPVSPYSIYKPLRVKPISF